MPNEDKAVLTQHSEIDGLRSNAEFEFNAPSVLDHLVYIVKMWWQHLTMKVNVPCGDSEYLMINCGLSQQQISGLYKQFRLLINDAARNVLTMKDLERHCSLLASSPTKRYTYRMLFWNSEKLTFREFVCNLSLTLSNCIGCPQTHLVKAITDTGFFNNVSSPHDVVQMQKLLSLFNCFDFREAGTLDTHSLSPLVYDLIRCDSNASVSSLVPHSMIRHMVNTTIVSVHVRFPKVCQQLCSDSSKEAANDPNSAENYFEGHRMVLTKELFIRDQESLHLDQLMAMRL